MQFLHHGHGVTLPKLLLCVMQTVQRTVLCMGRKQEAVENVPCGNTVGPSIIWQSQLHLLMWCRLPACVCAR